MFYGSVFKALNKAKVKYVVAGGVAVNLYGYQRFTKDLDIIVALEKKNLSNLFDTLGKIGYIPKVPVTKEQFIDSKERAKWKKEKGMIVFSFVQIKPPFNIIDMLVGEPISFSGVYKQKTYGRIRNIKVPIISIDHLIELKSKAARSRDLEDIANLREIKDINGL
jgi:predicted nucleotidyltransferase